ncbi:thioredoxin-disulfide reductase [candidate division WWE3 bacterium]|uniref:Thioredoxin reductase n=1 Tax=candidate division WWE3 bacterium TaxID=2053526 RepID=A0A955RSH2_UNCKA|nr:thioredoxin-disulfide reductase [candidate division WWE3 bacterium]
MEDVRKLAIIGSGPAGLTATIYAARANLSPIVLAGIEFGGQLMTTTKVENYPGFIEGIDGPELMNNMMEQAKRFGAEIVYEFVRSTDFSKKPFVLKTDSNEYLAESVIVATGSTPRRLGIESEQRFWGKGVSTCATCDGAFYKDKIVAVIGGGDSAMEESTFLTKFASKVYIIHRRDEFKASKVMQERALNNEKINIVWSSEVVEVVGDTFVTGLKLKDTNTGEESELSVDGMFLAIGHEPMTEPFVGQMELDPRKYIVTEDGVHTSVDGVFVAGDVADHVYQQAITAAGMGCKAAIMVEKYLAG